MISLSEAQLLVKQKARSFGIEKILLDDAVGRVITSPFIADRDYPPFNRATMDGIAINITDWETGIKQYNVVATLFAGNTTDIALSKGCCYKIMTGAAVPASANTVIRKEDLIEADERLHITVSELKPYQNIAIKGQDIKSKTTIINPPHFCNEASITLLASLGYAEINVERLPKISILTTGDEIVAIQEPVNEVQIRNSNAHLLKALLKKWQINTTNCFHIKDDETTLSKTIQEHLDADILILSGAVSAGDADFVPAVLTKLGAINSFHKVAIRPGKPIWFGTFNNGPVVFALPGNPFSTLATFKLFIEPFLYHCFGIPQPEPLYIPIQSARVKHSALDEFFPVTFSGNPSVAINQPFNTSGDITATINARALAQHPAHKMELAAGETVACILL